MDARERTRVHALDGAVLLFQPSTGTSLLLETDVTTEFRRRAPRVVLFSLSHACNLGCGFCSRDADQRARWSGDDAFRTLQTLWRAGTLEVSFGGGEPLVHPGFIGLLERLHAETTLALHFTTNGTRVTAALAERLAPLVGELRLSVCEEQAWESALRTLVSAGIRAGVNVMATSEALGRLPSIMQRASEAGACDVAVLRYVGDDPSFQADAPTLSMLEQAVLAAPLPVRVSNCMLDSMPNVPRLFPGLTVAGRDGLARDCGAGRDFVVIDPDAGVRSCSFHADRVDLGDVEAWLEHYREGVEYRPAPKSGCARPVPVERVAKHGAFAYRSFASNNSGDTILVARFESVDDADAFASILPPEGVDGEWEAFLREQKVIEGRWYGEAPTALWTRGRTLLASGYDAEDALQELRVLLWRARATCLYTAVHIHDNPSVVVGIRDPNETLPPTLKGWGMEASRRGPLLLASGQGGDWPELLTRLGEELEGLEWTAELVEHRPQEGWTAAMQHLHEAPFTERGYIYARCVNVETAATLAESLDGRVSRAGDSVLCSVSRFRPRTGQFMSKGGGSAWWIPDMPLRIRLWAYSPGRRMRLEEAPLLEVAEGKAALKVHDYAVSAVAETGDPHATMALMQSVLDAVRVQVPSVVGGAWVVPVQPLLAAARRVQHELRVLR